MQAHTNGHSTSAQPTNNNGTPTHTQSAATDHTPQGQANPTLERKTPELRDTALYFVIESSVGLEIVHTTLPPAWLLAVECCFAADQELPELWSA